MTPLDPGSATVILALAIAGLIAVFVIPAAVLRWSERRWPRFSEWLDERFGPENDLWR